MRKVLMFAGLGIIVFIGGSLHPANIPYTHLDIIIQSTGIGLLVIAIIIKLSMMISRRRVREQDKNLRLSDPSPSVKEEKK